MKSTDAIHRTPPEQQGTIHLLNLEHSPGTVEAQNIADAFYLTLDAGAPLGRLADPLEPQVLGEEVRQSLPTFNTSPDQELLEAQARLCEYEARTAELQLLLSELQSQLTNKNDLLHWIMCSRSWRLTTWLRRLNFL